MRIRLLLSEKFHIDVRNETSDTISNYMKIGNEIIGERNQNIIEANRQAKEDKSKSHAEFYKGMSELIPNRS